MPVNATKLSFLLYTFELHGFDEVAWQHNNLCPLQFAANSMKNIILD